MGTAGALLAMAELAAAFEAAVRRGRTVASLPHRSPDMYNGTAGRVRFHLLLYQVTGEREALEQATQAASVLASAAEAGPDGTRAWRIPPGYGDMSGEVFLGYAHGTAGIADALLDSTQVTGDDRYLDAITGAAIRTTRHCRR